MENNTKINTQQVVLLLAFRDILEEQFHYQRRKL